MKRHQLLYFLLILIFSACKSKVETPMPSSNTNTNPSNGTDSTSSGEINKTPLTYLALGDSYTIGESVSATGRYPVLLQNALEKKGYIFKSNAEIIATTGWTTQNLIDAIAAQLNDSAKYSMVSLLIGVNNQYQGMQLEEYKIQFRALLEKAVALAGGTKQKVFVVSIPDYGYTPFGQRNQAGISSGIDLFNTANRYIADSMGVRYFDITPISRKGLDAPSLVASDGLHPSEIMYQQWVDLMLPGIEKLLK